MASLIGHPIRPVRFWRVTLNKVVQSLILRVDQRQSGSLEPPEIDSNGMLRVATSGSFLYAPLRQCSLLLHFRQGPGHTRQLPVARARSANVPDLSS